MLSVLHSPSSFAEYSYASPEELKYLCSIPINYYDYFGKLELEAPKYLYSIPINYNDYFGELELEDTDYLAIMSNGVYEDDENTYSYTNLSCCYTRSSLSFLLS
jgi:hypothetical protein